MIINMIINISDGMMIMIMIMIMMMMMIMIMIMMMIWDYIGIMG